MRAPDGKMHHARCPRLLAALEAEQLGNGNNDFVGSSAVGGGSGIVAVAPRASPEVSETELSLNQCTGHRSSLHRHASLTNGSENNIHATEVRRLFSLAAIASHFELLLRWRCCCCCRVTGMWMMWKLWLNMNFSTREDLFTFFFVFMRLCLNSALRTRIF